MSDCQNILGLVGIALSFFSEKTMDDICRMCLQKGTKSNFINLNFGQPTLKYKLMTLIPELNMDVIQEPSICGPCSAALENAYQLKVKCLRSEEKIWSHLHQSSMSLKPYPTPIPLINLIPPSEQLSGHEEIMVEPNLNYYHHSHEQKRFENSYHQLETNKKDKTFPNKPTDLAFVCTTCKQSFATKEELHVHIPKHLAARPYMCTYCYKCFSLKSNLHIHIRTHTQDRPFICDFCPKSFTTKGNLKTHIRVHTKEKPFVCDICDKAFIQKVQLNTHKLLHINDQIFACNICEKSFTTRSTLQVHKRIHEDVKPFRCEYCEKTFTTNGNLVIHLRKHTGEKPYSCNYCGKSFSQSGQVKVHKRTSHSEKVVNGDADEDIIVIENESVSVT